jgi:hypothetical protein
VKACGSPDAPRGSWARAPARANDPAAAGRTRAAAPDASAGQAGVSRRSPFTSLVRGSYTTCSGIRAFRRAPTRLGVQWVGGAIVRRLRCASFSRPKRDASQTAFGGRRVLQAFLTTGGPRRDGLEICDCASGPLDRGGRRRRSFGRALAVSAVRLRRCHPTADLHQPVGRPTLALRRHADAKQLLSQLRVEPSRSPLEVLVRESRCRGERGHVDQSR